MRKAGERESARERSFRCQSRIAATSICKLADTSARANPPPARPPAQPPTRAPPDLPSFSLNEFVDHLASVHGKSGSRALVAFRIRVDGGGGGGSAGFAEYVAALGRDGRVGVAKQDAAPAAAASASAADAEAAAAAADVEVDASAHFYVVPPLAALPRSFRELRRAAEGRGTAPFLGRCLGFGAAAAADAEGAGAGAGAATEGADGALALNLAEEDAFLILEYRPDVYPARLQRRRGYAIHTCCIPHTPARAASRNHARPGGVCVDVEPARELDEAVAHGGDHRPRDEAQVQAA